MNTALLASAAIPTVDLGAARGGNDAGGGHRVPTCRLRINAKLGSNERALVIRAPPTHKRSTRLCSA
jgi:hypothetical protein